MNVTVRLSAPSDPQLPSGRSLLSQIWLVSVSLLALFNAGAKAQQAIVLVGSGSTVPAPLFARWVVEYGKRNPQVRMQYLPWGTSAGIREISHGNGDFAAGEVLLTAKERADGALTELPAAIIAIGFVASLLYDFLN
jgi:ABC-type phosphate transport system substrate-binding protein